MRRARGRVAVIDVGVLHLLDGPDLRAGVKDDIVFGSLAGLVGVDELRGVCVDRFFQTILEVTRDDDGGIGRLHDETAVAKRLAALHEVAGVVNGILGAVDGKIGLTLGVCSQCAELDGKRQLAHAVRGVDDVAAGIALHGAVLIDDIEIVGQSFDGVIDVLIRKFRIALLVGFEGLALRNGPEVLAVGHDEAHGLVSGDADVFLRHLRIGIELLVLTIGADDAAQEGEQEHGNQHRKTDHCQPVPEKPLCYQRAGRQDLNTAVIVQRKVLSFLSVLVFQFLSIILHNKSRSFLTQCVPAGLPRRTGCRIAGYRSGSEWQ